MIGCLSGILRGDSLLQALDESDYYQKSYEGFCEQAEGVLDKAGISKAALETALPLRDFYISQKQYMQAMIQEEEPTFSEETMSEQMAERMLSYYKESGISLSVNQNEAIEEAAKVLAQEYGKWIRLDFVRKITEYWNKLKKAILIAMPVCILLGGIIVTVLLHMYEYRHKALRYVASGMLGAGILTAVTVYLLRQAVDYVHIVSEPDWYQDFIGEYFSQGIQAIEYQEIFAVILCLTLIGIISVMRRHVTGE